ncbi:MAG: MerR family transcriptional regulator [Treponemataceae bacterium]|nr:MerR family transcriptional regulator [Treponemataceae bacterium]
MAAFSIVELSEITGVKTHVLQYWEELVPLIKPKKDPNGRKFYSQDDLKVFLRLRYLVNDKKFTIEGAYQQIQCEMAGLVEEDPDELHKRLKEIRNDLTEIYSLVRKYGKER